MTVLKNIAIYGAGGFGKETEYLLRCINRNEPQYSFRGFIDDDKTRNLSRAKDGDYSHLVIAIANGSIRKKIFESTGRQIECPNLIHPNVDLDPSNVLGKGLIVCSGVRMTVDIAIRDFVIINLNTTIGHDVVIGAFSSIMPGVNISGNVKLGNNVFIGSGATILQGITIGNNATIGAGAVVTKNVADGVTVKGVPARI
jgi:sugar O-acyltransferase (sialic acid O-acetyltransferase NeuD family)